MTEPDRQSRVATSILAAITGAAAWLSAGTIAYTSGGADRVAALPPIPYLIAATAGAAAIAYVVRLRLVRAWPMAISILIFLPYLPGNIPAAFMVWQGPLEAAVWALIAVGVIGLRTIPGALSDPVRAPWLAAAAAATLSLVAFSQVRTVVPGGDEPHYLVATQSLIGDRDLKVENNYAAGDYLEYFGGRLQPHFLQRSVSGDIYSVHSPGVSAMVLPAFVIAGYPGAVLTVIAIAALTAALTWMLAWRVTRNGAAAWVGLLAVFATAPFLFHTFTIYPDGPGALMVISAVWLIVRLLDDEEPEPRVLIGVGAGLAVLPWLHTRFAILSAGLGVVIVALQTRRRLWPSRVATFLAVPIVAAAAWFAFFWIVWGTPNPLAAYGRDTESSASFIARGLSGLLFDQQHGVLATAPIYAVAAIGLWPMLKQRRPLAVIIVVITLTYAIAVSTYAMWWAGASAPARLVAAILPLASALIALAWATYPNLRVPVFLLLMASITLVIPRVFEDSGRFVFNSRGAFDPTIEWLSQNVDLSLALPSAHRDSPGGVLRDSTPWLLAIGLVMGQSIAAARAGISRALTWTLAVCGAGAVLMVAVTFVWTMRGVRPVTADRSILAALASQRSWHVMLVDASRWRLLTQEQFLSQMTIDAPADRSAALLRLRRVPAGEYDIAAAEPSAMAMTALVSRNDPVLETGVLPLRLRLPVALSTLSIRAEAIAPPASTIHVKPARITEAVDERRAIHAARYGRARVFFFDERAYPEPNGFWTRAEGDASVVIETDDGARQQGLPLTIRSGAAATTIGISVGEWSQSYSLTPGERREITLPPLGKTPAWVVNIHSGPGFRPFQREPGSTDVRSLAAWFEIP